MRGSLGGALGPALILAPLLLRRFRCLRARLFRLAPIKDLYVGQVSRTIRFVQWFGLGKHLFDGREKAAALRGDALIGAARLLRGLHSTLSRQTRTTLADAGVHAPSAAHGHCRQLPMPRAPACPSAHLTATAARSPRSTSPAPAPPSLGAHCSDPLALLSPRAPQQTPASNRRQ